PSAFAEGGTEADDFIRGVVERTLPACRDKLRVARVAVDDLAVHTLHGFCRRLIDENAFETGVPFELDLVDDEQALTLEGAREFYRATFYGDAFAAQIAASFGWSPEALLRETREVRNRFGMRVEPKAQPLDVARSGLSACYTQLRAAFDRTELESYLAVEALRKAKSGRQLGSDNVRDTLERVEAFLQGRGVATPEEFGRLTPPQLAECFKKSRRPEGKPPRFFEVCARWVAQLESFRHSVRVAFLDALQRNCSRLKRERGVFAYDDLLLFVNDALEDPVRAPALRDAVRARYDAVLIDEFQDTDSLQWRIFDRLFGSGRLFLIGDPKQSIYRFRGADVFAYLDAAKKADRRYSLDRNWRSSSGLVSAVNAVFEAVPAPFVFEEIGYARVEAGGLADLEPLAGDGGRPLEWLWAGDGTNRSKVTEAVAIGVAGKIAELLGGGVSIGGRPLTADSIAVLVATNDQGRLICRALRELGIAAVVSASDNVFSSDEAIDLLRVLQAVLQPAAGGRVRAALATRICGLRAQDIARLDQQDEVAEEYLSRFDDFLRCWREEGFAAMATSLLSEFDVRCRFLAQRDGVRRLTDLMHLLELAEQVATRDGLSPSETVAWLRERLAGAAEGADAETERRLETESGAVRVVTTHKSKGLEYDVVFCPFLWDPGRSPDPCPVVAHEGTQLVADFGSGRIEERRALRAAEELAEKMRLAYVALTRAKHRCFVVAAVGGSGRHGEAPLAHLLLRDGGPNEGESPAQWVERQIARIDEELSRDPTALRRAVEALVASHPEVMQLSELAQPSDVMPAGPVEDRPELRARCFPEGARSRLVPWRISSFSSLTERPTEDAPDHADPGLPASEPAAAVGVYGFARGVRAGHCLHEILEQVDFPRLRDDRTSALIRETLVRHGLDRRDAHDAPIEPEAVVQDLLDSLAGMSAPIDGVRLGDVPQTKRLNEWRFFVPVSDVSTRDLAAVMRDASDGRVAEEYAGRVESLRRD
ncbi:MAG: hypothetical protein D6760_08475, partial [Deltaproteobacteria bacterium]